MNKREAVREAITDLGNALLLIDVAEHEFTQWRPLAEGAIVRASSRVASALSMLRSEIVVGQRRLGQINVALGELEVALGDQGGQP